MRRMNQFLVPLLLLLATAVLLASCGGGGGGGGGEVAPTAPSGLMAAASSTTQIDLTWADRSNNETSFHVQRSSSPVFDSIVATVLSSNTTTFRDTGLAPASIYYYRIAAVGSGGASYSNTAFASTFSVSTLVSTGSGSADSQSGSADADPGSAARFNYPHGIATTASGTTLYVADTQNHTIRAVAVIGGAVTTLAGTALTSGSADGTGGAARFSRPMGIAVTADDSALYIADTLNHTIRKIVTANGLVSTIAGTAGNRGADDGIGSAALFNQPESVAVSGSSTTLYVADTLNHAIRAISLADSSVATLAGTALAAGAADGTGSAARFNQPAAIALSPDGATLYVADRMNHTIRSILVSDGSVSTIAGTAGASGTTNGTGADARFNMPSGLAVSSDGLSLFVADTGSHTIRKIDLNDNSVTTPVGTPGVIGANTGTSTNFNHPTGLAKSGGMLYIADTNNHAIRMLDVSLPGTVYSLAGYVSPNSAAPLSQPYGITTTPSGTVLYVSDRGYHRIFQVEISSGTITTFAGPNSPFSSPGYIDGVGTAAQFNGPFGIATDGTSLFVADTYNNLIRQIEISTATVSTLAGQRPVETCLAGTCATDGIGSTAEFWQPAGVATTATGTYSNYVYVADTYNHLIRQIDKTTREVTTLAGTAGLMYPCNAKVCYADGVGTAARFYAPWGLVVDGQYLYVADTVNHAIRRIDLASRAVITIAGKAGTQGNTDGLGVNARFYYPQRLVVKDGALYISDSYNSTIRKLDLNTFVVSTVAGLAGVTGNTNDGTGTNARFNHPSGVTTDGTSVFVADTNNHMIRVIH